MKQFLMIIRGGTYESEGWSADHIAQHMERWGAYMGGLAEKGALLAGEELYDEGKVVRKDNTQDGPFAEGKEVVGGYILVQAEDLDAAAVLAQGCPVYEMTHGSIEVRELKFNEELDQPA